MRRYVLVREGLHHADDPRYSADAGVPVLWKEGGSLPLLMEDETREDSDYLRRMVDNGQINAAEDRLFELLESAVWDDDQKTALTLLFYEYVNGKDDEFLRIADKMSDYHEIWDEPTWILTIHKRLLEASERAYDWSEKGDEHSMYATVILVGWMEAFRKRFVTIQNPRF